MPFKSPGGVHLIICGAKVGFAKIFLMPQPPLLTRRGILVSDEFCREPSATHHQREYKCRTRGRRCINGDRNTRDNHVAPFIGSNSQGGDAYRLSGKYPEESLEPITH